MQLPNITADSWGNSTFGIACVTAVDAQVRVAAIIVHGTTLPSAMPSHGRQEIPFPISRTESPRVTMKPRVSRRSFMQFRRPAMS
jgi:hypothetical protein